MRIAVAFMRNNNNWNRSSRLHTIYKCSSHALDSTVWNSVRSCSQSESIPFDQADIWKISISYEMLYIAEKGPFDPMDHLIPLLKLKDKIFQIGRCIHEKCKIRHKLWIVELQKSGLMNYRISCMRRPGRITVKEILFLLVSLHSIAWMQALVSQVTTGNRLEPTIATVET